MRVLRDVVVNQVAPGELLAISQVPAVPGEDMCLGLTGGGASMDLKVKVLESRPVIIQGAVRHRVRLAVATISQELPLSAPAVMDMSAGAEAV